MRSRIAIGLLALAAAGVFVADAARYRGYLIDDTFISLRYARNLVEGHGLVFNPGERVEGYSNFLWVLLAAGFIRLHIDPVAATRAVSLLMALLTLALLPAMERRGPALAMRPRWLSAAVVLLLPLAGFAYWSVASFETLLFTGLLTAAVACLMREGERGRGHWSALLFVALALTRPEGLILFAVAMLAFGAVEAWTAAPLRVLRRHAVNAALVTAGAAAHLAWRYHYYGQWLPNTYYAKVPDEAPLLSTGAAYLGEWALEYPLLAAALVLPLGVVSYRRRRLASDTAVQERASAAQRFAHPEPAERQSDRVPRRAMRASLRVAPVYAIVLAHCAFVVAVGGDFMSYSRFLLPIAPLACLLLAWTIGAWAVVAPRAARAALVGGVVINAVASHLGVQPLRAFVAHRTAVVGERVGIWLGAELPARDLIAVNTAGAVPYFSRLPALDMLGLTDATVARRPIYIVSRGWSGHRRGWGAYVMARRPRAVLWYNSAGARAPFYLSDHELADDPYFRFFYRLRVIELPASAGPPAPVAIFLGAPFGAAGATTATSGDLALRAEVRPGPVRHTVLYEAPIIAHYFAWDDADASLWPLRDAHGGDVAAFVAAVAAQWAQAPLPAPLTGAERARVEDLGEQARRHIEAGDYAPARALLSEAVRLNARVRSPTVYQYVANLAVLTGDLFTALAAQKEALRLAPESELYRRNLVSLLTTPYDKLGSRRIEGQP